MRKVEFLIEITSYLLQNLNTEIIYFQFKEFYVLFITLQSIGLKFFAKIMKGSCVFCCSSCIIFNLQVTFSFLISDVALLESDTLTLMCQILTILHLKLKIKIQILVKAFSRGKLKNSYE